MSETTSINLFLPIEGTQTSVSISTIDGEYVMVKSDSVFRDYQLNCCIPEGDAVEPWFELSWSLEREDGDETSIEEDGIVSLSCPNCGGECSVGFTKEEFEHLDDFCSTCGDSTVLIRDQPTERGQSHIVNYTVQMY